MSAGTASEQPTTTEDAEAERIIASLQVPIRFRPRSSDALVIAEILGQHAAYSGRDLPSDPRWLAQPTPAPATVTATAAAAANKQQQQQQQQLTDFSPAGHVVLDVGAHIGVFSRYALAGGARRVFAFEPEPGNLALLRENLQPWLAANGSSSSGSSGVAAEGEKAGAAAAAVAVVHAVAMCAGAPGVAPLVLGRARASDGMANTWRHALEGLNHYKEAGHGGGGGAHAAVGGGAAEAAAGAGCSLQQLERVPVATLPLFGPGGILSGSAGDEPATFVKIDAEGAELAVLGAVHDDTAAQPAAWGRVTHVVLEWSFTKDRRMATFRRAVARLRRAGFVVMFDFAGSAWEALNDWPWHTDAMVFAARALAPVAHAACGT